jgi:hypothetical protein
MPQIQKKAKSIPLNKLVEGIGMVDEDSSISVSAYAYARAVSHLATLTLTISTNSGFVISGNLP